MLRRRDLRDASAINAAGSRIANRELPINSQPRFSVLADFMYSASPMLDLGYVRDHLDVIEKMGRERGIALDLGPFRALDTERRALITSAERLKAERNRASEEIARKKKAGEDASEILALMKEVSDRIKRDDERIGLIEPGLRLFGVEPVLRVGAVEQQFERLDAPFDRVRRIAFGRVERGLRATVGFVVAFGEDQPMHLVGRQGNNARTLAP